MLSENAQELSTLQYSTEKVKCYSQTKGEGFMTAGASTETSKDIIPGRKIRLRKT